MPNPITATANLTAQVDAARRRFGIVGNSPMLLSAIERAVKVAPIDLSVLVTGESGSGKEFFPKIIHQFGARKHKKYIAVNCGAIPEGTIDSELFGHEKGSFTGAISARKGYFEEADGGTIFLDEVAELPLTTQARLLRVLETGEYLKVGSSTVQKTNIRVVAATNVDLLEAVRKHRFREDLFYRLSTICINVPTLHDRGDDILLLARKFAGEFSEKYMTAPITFSPEAERFMLIYRWPGNVRQLKNIVEQVALFEAGTEVSRETLMSSLPRHSESDSLVTIPHNHTYEVERDMLWKMMVGMKEQIEDLQRRLRKYGQETEIVPPERREAAEPSPMRSLIKYPYDLSLTAPADNADAHVGAHSDLPSAVSDAEKDVIAASLARNSGNRRSTARELGISERTLYRKIREFGISSQQPPEEDPS